MPYHLVIIVEKTKYQIYDFKKIINMEELKYKKTRMKEIYSEL